MTWLPSQDGVLAFARGTGVTCIANLSDGPIGFPPHAEILLASAPLTTTVLPPDTTVWLRGSGDSVESAIDPL
jgi:alpha-glucosidase